MFFNSWLGVGSGLQTDGILTSDLSGSHDFPVEYACLGSILHHS